MIIIYICVIIQYYTCTLSHHAHPSSFIFSKALLCCCSQGIAVAPTVPAGDVPTGDVPPDELGKRMKDWAQKVSLNGTYLELPDVLMLTTLKNMCVKLFIYCEGTLWGPVRKWMKIVVLHV